jgi:hypothetical protein
MSATNAKPASAPQANPRTATGRQLGIVIYFELPSQGTPLEIKHSHNPTCFAA